MGTNALPRFDAAGSTAEQGMALRTLERSPPAIVRGTTHRKLSKQVFPFILDLSSRYGDRCYGAYGSYLGMVKGVTPRCGLGVNGAQVGTDSVPRRCVSLKPLELRMMAVAFGCAPKYCPRKQRLAPQGDEPLRVEIARVNRPKPHQCLAFELSRG